MSEGHLLQARNAAHAAAYAQAPGGQRVRRRRSRAAAGEHGLLRLREAGRRVVAAVAAQLRGAGKAGLRHSKEKVHVTPHMSQAIHI